METAPQTRQSILLPLGIVLLLTLGVSFIPASWLGVKPAKPLYAPLDLSNVHTIGTDTDNDGVISWKEFIAGSLGAQPNTIDANALQTDPHIIAALNDENNLTSSFSKNLYIASTLLQQNNVTDPQTEQETFTSLLAEEAKKIAPVEYSERDITTAANDSDSTKKAYGNKLASTVASLITEDHIVSDLQSISTFAQSGNDKDLDPLRKRVQELDAMIDVLKTIPVPPSAKTLHLTALNRIVIFRNTLDGFTKAYDDPIRATFSLENYTTNATSAGYIYPEMSVYFHNQNITFTQKEPGYVFVAGYTKLQAK